MNLKQFSSFFYKIHKFRNYIFNNPHLFQNRLVDNKMSKNSNLLKPCDSVYGMKKLDKSKFSKQIEIPCLKLNNVKLSTILPTLKKYLLKIEKFKATDRNDKETIIYLNPEIIEKFDDLSIEDREFLMKLSIDSTNFERRSHMLNFNNFSTDVILKSVLPNDQEGLSSFTKIGHIVHVNLREHLLPYKNLIGEVLYEKIPGCRSVVNKIDIIDTTYRNFKMEILKGDDDMIVQVKENKCLFEFDFSKVYWNSRLCTEHQRIVDMLKPNDILFDIFAGVGPFSIPAAKRKCTVYANDLNPESFKWLNHNKKLNKIGDNLETFNKDGKDFILNEMKVNLFKYLNKNDIYIVMNLPALAVEFLSNFIGLYKDEELEKQIDKTPTIIVYCFAKGEDYINITKNLLFTNIGGDISDKIIEIFRVRTVSSLKEMMRIVFKLDRDLLVGNIGGGSSCNKRKFNEIEQWQQNLKKCKFEFVQFKTICKFIFIL